MMLKYGYRLSHKKVLSSFIFTFAVIYFLGLDTISVKCYYSAMTKREQFQKTIKRKRKHLLSCGYLPSTLTMWAQGDRIPRPAQAEKLSELLNISIDKIPQRANVIK